MAAACRRHCCDPQGTRGSVTHWSTTVTDSVLTRGAQRGVVPTACPGPAGSPVALHADLSRGTRSPRRLQEQPAAPCFPIWKRRRETVGGRALKTGGRPPFPSLKGPSSVPAGSSCISCTGSPPSNLGTENVGVLFGVYSGSNGCGGGFISFPRSLPYGTQFVHPPDDCFPARKPRCQGLVLSRRCVQPG